MSAIDKAIAKYAALVAPWGVDAIRRDAQLILDGTPCNESRGWYGTKPGCKRDKDKSAAKKASKKAGAAKKKPAKTTTKAKAKTATKTTPKTKSEELTQSKIKPLKVVDYVIPEFGKSAVTAFDLSAEGYSLRTIGDVSSGEEVIERLTRDIPKSIDELDKDIPAYIKDYYNEEYEGKAFTIFSAMTAPTVARPIIERKLKSLGAEEIPGREGIRGYALTIDKGKLRVPNDQERKELSTGKERWGIHQKAIDEIFAIELQKAIHQRFGGKNKAVNDVIKEHQTTTKKLWKMEDEAFDRKPSKQSREKLEKQLQQEASDWAKSQGFTGEGVNGFSAEATAAHDIAHPATHRLIGLDSNGIHKAFGALKDKEGKPSLLAEEALVNAVEHLSRGDSKEASIQNGLRLARVLSRSGTQEEREYVRSEEFARGIIDLISNRAYRNDEYSNIMPIVRDYNIKSGTVTASGSDFTNTATGG